MRSSNDVLYISDNRLGHRLAKNVTVTVKRTVSGETVTTNQFGWRVSTPGIDQVEEAKFSFIGCSWAMGTGNEFENSIVGHFEQIKQTKANNLGVGSYSLLQAILLLEENIEAVCHTDVILLHGSWLVDRSIKDRANPVMFRPIFARERSRQKVRIQPPRNAPAFFARAYVKLSKSEALPTIARLAGMRAIVLICFLFHGTIERAIAKVLRIPMWRRLNLSEDRKLILEENLDLLAKVLRRKPGMSLTVVQLAEYFRSDPGRQGILEAEADIWKNWCADRDNVQFIDVSDLQKTMTDTMRAESSDFRAALETIHWTDNNHPNSRGSRIIAEHVAKNVA